MILIILLIFSLVCFAITGIMYLSMSDKDCGFFAIVCSISAIFSAIIICIFCSKFKCDDNFKEKYNRTKFLIENGYCTNKTLNDILEINITIKNAKRLVKSDWVGAFIDNELLEYQSIEVSVKLNDLVMEVDESLVINLMN